MSFLKAWSLMRRGEGTEVIWLRGLVGWERGRDRFAGKRWLCGFGLGVFWDLFL